MKKPRIRAWLCAAGLLATGACGAGESPPAVEAPIRAAPESSTPTGSAALPPGSFRMELRDGRLSLRSRTAGRVAILTRLAAEAGFELELGQMPSRAFTVTFEGQELAQALRILLAGVPYDTSFEADPSTGFHTLASLRAGTFADTEPGTSSAGGAPERSALHTARSAILDHPLLTGEADSELSADQREAEEVRRAALSRLDDPDPDQRIRAASFLRPTADGLEQLRALAVGDPQPQVRAAAVSQLGEGESFGAVEGLVEALEDPEPVVVLEAIDELAYQDDVSVVRHLESLLGHADARVAEAAAEAIAFLEF